MLQSSETFSNRVQLETKGIMKRVGNDWRSRQPIAQSNEVANSMNEQMRSYSEMVGKLIGADIGEFKQKGWGVCYHVCGCIIKTNKIIGKRCTWLSAF